MGMKLMTNQDSFADAYFTIMTDIFIGLIFTTTGTGTGIITHYSC